MEAIEHAPTWAKQVLKMADDHPGRRPNEIGISTVTYDPSITYKRIKGEDPPEIEDDGRMAQGTYLHWLLYNEAPNREVELRVKIPGTELYANGRIDAYEDGTVRDLKTSSLFQFSPERRESIEMQVALYVYAIRYGEANVGTHADPDWRPASEVLGPVDEIVIDTWMGGSLTWGHETGPDGEPEWMITGDDLETLVEGTWAWLEQQIKDMIADHWEPPTSEQADAITYPTAPDDIFETVIEGGHAKEQRDAASDEYDQKRAKVHAYQTDHGCENLVAGNYMAVYYSDSTRIVLHRETLEAVLDHHGMDMEQFQDTETFAKVTDDVALAEELQSLEVDVADLDGVELDTRTGLDEDTIENMLKRLPPIDGLPTDDEDDEDEPETALEQVQTEKVTSSGYTTIKKTTEG